jgi:type II secretory pathway pseudopilin PulG
MNTLIRLRREGGFTIIEALVALLIMTFGMLAISGMQMTLSQNSDISKQRTEATRLANEKMEQLRAYTSIAEWNALASGSDNITTNTQYTRTWSLAGSNTNTYRPVTVNVSWLDRTGDPQGITLQSVISQTNPSDVGFLGFPLPENLPLKRVKNRSLDIPIPAVSLTSAPGYSGYNLSGTNLSVVFSDYDGAVVKTCPSSLTSGSSLTGCTTVTAVIVAGYVYDPRISTSYNYRSTTTTYIDTVSTTTVYTPTTTSVSTPVYGYTTPTLNICSKMITPRLSGCTNGSIPAPTYANKPYCYTTVITASNCPGGYTKEGTTLTYGITGYTTTTTTTYIATGTITTTITTTVTAATNGSTQYKGVMTGTNAISATGISWWDVSSGTAVSTTTRTITCVVDQAINQINANQITNYKYYLCVIYLGTDVLYSGTLRLKGIPKNSTDSSKQFLGCRYQYKDTSLGDAARNVQPYYLVGDSIDNQNYLVDFSTTTTEGSTAVCPTGTLVVTSGSNAMKASLTAALQAAAELVVHQDCRNLASNTSINTNCPQ